MYTSSAILPAVVKGGVVVSPEQPAPYVMTSAEALRFLRLDDLNDGEDWLYRHRRAGLLRGTQVGRHIRYLLPELVAFLERQTEEKPR